mmetsp:Transcript_22865/g.47334  ORF Transcript_22865/g.47334 Transcript_22865/m.47334 type:complete len:241 (+) Transcript_22865:37-759(+)
MDKQGPGKDCTGVFPHSKIKAQILRDEEVGRISSKAIELLGACSALFVSDLVRSKAMEVSSSNNTSEMARDSSAQAKTASRGRMKSLRKRKKFIPISNPKKTKKNLHLKQYSSDKGNDANEDDVVRREPFDLHRIKMLIKHHSPKYNFLKEALDGLTEENVYEYDTAAIKNRRNEENSNGGKATKAVADKVQKLQSARISGDLIAGGSRDEVTLKEAILYAQHASGDMRGEIIADDDDYD